MSAFSDYLSSGLLNHTLRATAYTAPTTVYIGLTQSFVSGNLKSGVIDEPSTGGYARQSYTSSTANWAAPYLLSGIMTTHNNNTISFPVASADIGNVSGAFIADASGAGNLLFYGQLSSARNIRNGDQFVFSSGSLKVTLV
jgi:hypothetical protein